MIGPENRRPCASPAGHFPIKGWLADAARHIFFADSSKSIFSLFIGACVRTEFSFLIPRRRCKQLCSPLAQPPAQLAAAGAKFAFRAAASRVAALAISPRAPDVHLRDEGAETLSRPCLPSVSALTGNFVAKNRRIPRLLSILGGSECKAGCTNHLSNHHVGLVHFQTGQCAHARLDTV